VSILRSRDNPRVKRWAKLVRDARLRKKERRVLVEGPNLVEAALHGSARVQEILVSESAAHVHRRLLARAGHEPVVVSDAVLKAIVESETPQGIAAEIDLPAAPAALRGSAVFLEAVQDPGNVGALLRTAAAFGISSAVLDSACADPWSAKVLRAAAGAHFALGIMQSGQLADAVAGFKGKVVCTLPHKGTPLNEADLSGRLGWIFGSEGQGVSPALQAKAGLLVRIPAAASVESLNVAAAAAICLYAAFNTPAAGS
jgi:TrmH family RNA methyltransferase